MDVFLLVIAGILLIAGIIGCFLPIIPGPPLSYGALVIAHYTDYASFSSEFHITFILITVFVTVLDYIIPIWGTKKFGGSKAGIRGSTIGMFVGLIFFPPIGIILGPVVGAIIGEMVKGQAFKVALRSGWGSFVGFLLSTGLKLAACLAMLVYFVKAIF